MCIRCLHNVQGDCLNRALTPLTTNCCRQGDRGRESWISWIILSLTLTRSSCWLDQPWSMTEVKVQASPCIALHLFPCSLLANILACAFTKAAPAVDKPGGHSMTFPFLASFRLSSRCSQNAGLASVSVRKPVFKVTQHGARTA